MPTTAGHEAKRDRRVAEQLRELSATRVLVYHGIFDRLNPRLRGAEQSLDKCCRMCSLDVVLRHGDFAFFVDHECRTDDTRVIDSGQRRPALRPAPQCCEYLQANVVQIQRNTCLQNMSCAFTK